MSLLNEVKIRCLVEGAKLRAVIRELDVYARDELTTLIELNPVTRVISLEFKRITGHSPCLILNDTSDKSRIDVDKHCPQILLVDNAALYELVIINPLYGKRRSGFYYLIIYNENHDVLIHMRVSYRLIKE